MILDDKKIDSTILSLYGCEDTGNEIVINCYDDADLGKGYKYIYNPRQYEYVVKLAETVSKVPTLTPTYDETKYEVDVQMSKAFGALSKVVVKDKVTGKTVTYKYKFIVDTKTAGYEEYLVNEVINATGHKDVTKILDGENGTSLSAYERQELVFEFEEAI